MEQLSKTKTWGTARLMSLLLALVMLPAAQLLAQSVTLKGTVVDDLGDPVIGATVAVVEDASKGALTNLDGEFTIPNAPAKGTLRISYVGMKTIEIPINGQTNFSITLHPDNELLDEVVVVGYGTQKKVNLTGSVATVDTKTLEARPVKDLAQALQGTVPGLNFSVNNAGGQLDSKMSFNIRGAGTIGAGSNSGPLVLIDGTEGDLYSISPNDIASISVLKDAASSAIYGSRAAFGVILITTKSGKKGHSNFSYNGSVRFSTATQIPEMMNAYDFARYFNTAAINKGDAIVFNEKALERIKNTVEGNIQKGDEALTTWNGYGHNEPWAMYTGSWANTDWFAEMYRKNAPAQDHNVSFSGGSDKISYYLSGAILDQTGIIRHGKDTFRRYNLSGKITAEVAPWLTVTYNNRWVRENYSRPAYMTGLFFHNIARRWPTNPLRDPNGHYVPGNEIQQMEDGGLDRNEKDFLYQQVTAEFRPIEGWLIRLEGNYNTTQNNNHWDVLPVHYYDPNGVETPFAWDGDKKAGFTDVGETMWKTNYFNGRFYTEYSKLFAEKHDFKVLGGLDMELQKHTSLNAARKDLITPEVPTINNTTDKVVRLGYANNHWATMGMFARVNYVYDDRYLLEASIRRDGSSRFIGDKTWATFPTFSAGWNISNEHFFEPAQKYVNLLKLRGSWGALGNTNIKALYPWFQGIGTGNQNSWWLINGQKQNTAGVPGLVSPDLTWESVESWNIGTDFAFFNYRLRGSFDYFVRNTHNMVGPAPSKPSILGARQPDENNSDMQSKGWELELNWRDHVGEFNYGVKLVLSDDIQTITKYYNPSGSINDWYVGKRVGEIWGYQTVGIAQTKEEMENHLKNNQPSWGNQWGAGDVMYKNINDPVDKDGKVIEDRKGRVDSGANTLSDHGDLSIIGNSMPRYRFGINADASWKGIDFSIFLQGVGKRDFWDASPYFTGANHGMWQAAAFTEHLDFWRPEGDKIFGANTGAYYPRPQFDNGWKNFQTQTRYLQDASYIRIKNLQIGYTLPAEWTSKFSVNRLRFYFSADNLATFTKLSKIFDPEATGGDWGPGKIYPLSRTISFGVNVNI